MEEINLDFQKDNHKQFNVNSNLNSNVSDVNIMRSGQSDLGIELLMNKNKTGGDNKVEEFKPSDPVIFSGEIAKINSPPLGGPPSLLSFAAVS